MAYSRDLSTMIRLKMLWPLEERANMAHSKDLSTYRDVEDTLNRALESAKGIKVSFDTDRAAIRWLSRANAFRAEHRKLSRAVYEPSDSAYGTSPFDVLLMRREGGKVLVEIRSNGKVEEL